MRLFDAHNHLHDDRFGGRQTDLVTACREAGVVRMVVNGSCEADWPAVAELAARYPDLVIPAFGLHPWYVHERSAEWRDRLEECLDRTPGSTVGEVGLDRWILDRPPGARAGLSPGLASRSAAPIEEQRGVFEEQLSVAARRGLAVSIHCLQAWGALHEVLRVNRRPACGFLLHSYGGPQEMILPLARLGAYFGFPGYFLHARKTRQREVFLAVPADRLVVETDAPDQRLPGEWVPAGRELHGADGGELNHPANLDRVLAGLARVLGESETELSARCERNFGALFGKGPPGRGIRPP